MGQVLSEPITTKNTSSSENASLKVGVSSMQGWRTTMEDAHVASLAVKEDTTVQFFGVFDGHGGAKSAQYACKHITKTICSRNEYKTGHIESAIKKAFMELDQEMMVNPEVSSDFSGTTACCVLIKQNKFYCMNAGDSRAVASIKGHALPLSFDHKPNNIGEQARIVKAGGFVEFNRVNGNLALSRALGDFSFKQNLKKPADEQVVTAMPDVTVHTVTPDLEFIVIACDGIWDVMTNSEVIQFCRARISSQTEPSKICEDLMMRCLATECNVGGLGCDNMTVILVCFLQNEPYATLAKKCIRGSVAVTTSQSSTNQRQPTHPAGISSNHRTAGSSFRF